MLDAHIARLQHSDAIYDRSQFNTPWHLPLRHKHRPEIIRPVLSTLIELAQEKSAARLRWKRDASAAMERRATYNTAWKHEYAFDVQLWAVARVTAATEKEARAKLANYAQYLDIGMQTPDGVLFTEASSEGEYVLFEIDGEPEQ